MRITQYYFIPRTFMEAIHHKISNDWFNESFIKAWILYREFEGISIEDSYNMWMMGGEL